MKITKLSDDEFVLDVSSDEHAAIRQCLNEVTGGFKVPNFQDRIGVSYDKALVLLDQTSRRTRMKAIRTGEDELRLTLTREDVRVFINSMKETFTGLGDWEYQTRVGIFIDEVKTLVSQLEASL